MLKPSESRKEQREIKFKRPGSVNGQHSHDVISDGINQEGKRKQTRCQKALCHNETFVHAYKRIPQRHIKYMQTILYPVGCNISSGYKHNRKWIKYELAKIRMYSWARCCGMPGMLNLEITVMALFPSSPTVFLFTQFSLFYENLQLPLSILVKYWVLAF